MSFLATRPRPSTSAPGDGSRTLTVLDAQPRSDDSDSADGAGPAPAVGVLKLRGAARKNRQRVAWSDDVVDNEGAGKKSSKICCIYHKPRPFDESSSDDSDDSDAGDRARPHAHTHRRGQRCPPRSDGDGALLAAGCNVHDLDDEDDEPNAYEAVPGSKKGKGKAL